MTETRIFGQIFLPEKPEVKFKGVWLTIKENSIYLETPYNSLANESWEIINGEFNGLDRVTFVNVYAGSGSSGSGGTWRKLNVTYMIKGIHINNKSELIFKKMSMVSPTLSNWITEPGDIKKVDDNRYYIPSEQTILSTILNEVTISIILSHSHEYSFKSLKIEKNCVVIIETEVGMHLDKLSTLMRKIKKMILFITNKNPEFSQYYLLKNEREESYELINTRQNLNEKRFTQNITISYFNIKPSLKQVFQNWMVNEKLITMIDLIQEKNYNPEMSIQGRFLNICIAIENYHDGFITEKNQEIINYRKAKRKTITGLIEDEELKKWFRKTSKYWEKVDLRDKLNVFKDSIQEIMGNTFTYNPDELIDKILKTRNDIAHNGNYDKHFTLTELLLVEMVLEFCLKSEILKTLNYVPNKTSNILKDGRRHVEIIASLNEYNNEIKTVKKLDK